MNKIIVILLIILVIILLNPSSTDNFENINTNMGNHLADYYYYLFLSILQKKDFKYNESPYTFLKSLPTYIPFDDNIDIYNKLSDNNIKYDDYKDYAWLSFWECKNKNSEIIHSIMKPLMNKIIKTALIENQLKKNVSNIIIHFRCADTPFIKSHHYHFQRYQYFKDILDNLKNQTLNDNLNSITILTSNKWLSNEKQQKTCSIYVLKLKEYLESIGYSVNIDDTGDNLDDFAKMFFAPVIISTHSSFSFMSGYFGEGIYRQPTFIINDEEQCTDCGDFVYKGYNIKHQDIDDYHNINKVSELLNKKN